MDNKARECLKAILTAEGISVCRDPGRCDSLLRERCGAHRKEILWLVGALHEGVVPELLAVKPGESVEGCIARLTKHLECDLGLRADAARWTVLSWAFALGIAPQESLSQKTTAHVAQASDGKDDDLDEDDLDSEDDDIDEADLDGEDDDNINEDEENQEGIKTECPRPNCEYVEHVERAGPVHCSACGHDYEINEKGDITDPGDGVSEVTCGKQECKGVFYWEMNEVNHDEGGKQCPYCNFWNRDEAETECPNCGKEIKISEALNSNEEDATEATCPRPGCHWRFEIYDDGTTGSLDYLTEWRCPKCETYNQDDSHGEVSCRECKTSFNIDEKGDFNPEIIDWNCDHCGQNNHTQNQERDACSKCGCKVEFEKDK